MYSNKEGPLLQEFRCPDPKPVNEVLLRTRKSGSSLRLPRIMEVDVFVDGELELTPSPLPQGSRVRHVYGLRLILRSDSDGATLIDPVDVGGCQLGDWGPGYTFIDTHKWQPELFGWSNWTTIEGTDAIVAEYDCDSAASIVASNDSAAIKLRLRFAAHPVQVVGAAALVDFGEAPVKPLALNQTCVHAVTQTIPLGVNSSHDA